MLPIIRTPARRPRGEKTRQAWRRGPWRAHAATLASVVVAAVPLLAVARLDADGDEDGLVVLRLDRRQDRQELAARRRVGDLAHLRRADLQLDPVHLVSGVQDRDRRLLVLDQLEPVRRADR